jgi:hypothetical protein
MEIAPMRTVFETCQPRDEVLRGELREQQFAASLTRVLRGDADAVYGDPATFFRSTYATGGLRSLLTEALGRLTGAKSANAPVIRVETSFGGGKTHNLIALYHVCREPLAARSFPSFVPSDLLPKKPIGLVAGAVGGDLDAANGVDHGDVRTYTLWGEIAYQLAGAEGYRLVRQSDEQRTAPGTQVWEKLIGDDPALLLIDEIAEYLRKAKGVRSSSGKTTVAEQTIAFLMDLIKFAAESPRAVLVYTLADPKDAFGKETEEIRSELAEARSVSARQEHVLTPTSETEISAIVGHRLFAHIDRSAATEVAGGFSDYFTRMIAQRVDLPSRATRPEFRSELAQDYPFHPELLTTLNRKTSTIPNFQKTRGVLRLLAQAVRGLWQEKPGGCYLIAPHHLNLGDDSIAGDLTSRLDRPAFRQVIEADIASPRTGTLAHAQEVDRDWVDAGKPAYGRRVATTVFLHSLVQTGQSGVDPADLRLAVLQPGDDPALVEKAVQRLTDGCWFIDYDGHRYRFKTEPALRKIVDDETGPVGKIKAKAELDERIKKVWKKGVFAPKYFPAEASEVLDDAQAPKLVVIHYDAASAKAAQAVPPPDLVVKLFEHKGSLEEYRTYKNNLVFLVADADQVGRLVEVAQRYLAVQRIVTDPDRMSDFNKEQKEKLRNMAEAAELELRVAITKAYRHLYYPSADAPRSSSGLAHQLLQPDEQGEVEKDQSEVVLRVLKGLEKVLTADDKPIPPQYLKAKAWPSGMPSLSTEDLRRAFAQRLALKMLLNVDQLKRTVREGIGKGIWVYYPSEEKVGYGTASPPPLIEISEDVLLYTPEEARRLGIKIKGTEVEQRTCAVCKRPESECICDQDDEPEVKKPVRVHAEGPPAQSFQTVSDQCHDHKVKALRQVVVQVEGLGKDAAKDARSLGLAIPQIGKAKVVLEQKMVLEFGDSEKFEVNFTGSWDRYKRVKALTDALSLEASNASVRLVLRADFEGPGLAVVGEQFQTMRDVFNNLGIGRIAVEGEPATEGK